MADLRPLKSDLGTLTRPDGAVTFSQGDSAVIAAVYGPGEVKIAREQVDKTTVEVIYKPRSGLPGCAEKLQEQYIRNTVETSILASLHPRSCVSVTIQEVQNSGSWLACCINASCLTLLDACVNMKYQVAGINMVIDEEDTVIIDPTSKQEQACDKGLTVVVESKDFTIVTLASKGCLTPTQFDKCVQHAQTSAKLIFSFYRSALEKKMSKPSV